MTPVNEVSYVYTMQYLEQPLKKVYEKIHSKMLQISQNGILENVQVNHRKSGKRKHRNEKCKEQTGKKNGRLKP